MATNPWMTALQATLGGVGGYFGGRAEEIADEEKRQAEQRRRDLESIGLLGQFGYNLSPETAQSIGGDALQRITGRGGRSSVPAVPSAIATSPIQAALAQSPAISASPAAVAATPTSLGAQQMGGVQTPAAGGMSTTQPPGSATAGKSFADLMPLRQTLQQIESMYPAEAPQTVAGGALLAPISAQGKANAAMRQKMTEDAISRYMDAQKTITEKTAEGEQKTQKAKQLADIYTSAYVDAKGKPLSYNLALAAAMNDKTPIEMGFSERPMSAYEKKSVEQRQSELGISWARLKLDQDKVQKDNQGEVSNGLQAMGVARATLADKLITSNNQLMKQFEADAKSGKVKITGVQLELARKALAGETGSAMAMEALGTGKSVFGFPVIEPNPALLRYVRSAKAIATSVREITPRGGSNLLMQQEAVLNAIGAGMTDDESISQVQSIRDDLAAGVHAGVLAMTPKPAVKATGKGKPKIEAW